MVVGILWTMYFCSFFAPAAAFQFCRICRKGSFGSSVDDDGIIAVTACYNRCLGSAVDEGSDAISPLFAKNIRT